MAHWAQTPEGRKKLSEAMKNRWKKERANPKSKGERVIARAVKRAVPRETREMGLSPPVLGSPALVVDGWRVTFLKDEIRFTRMKVGGSS